MENVWKMEAEVKYDDFFVGSFFTKMALKQTMQLVTEHC